MSIRILVVDDHSVVRAGLCAFLRRDPQLEVVGEASDGVEAIEKARKLHPTVVVMDLFLPHMDGIEATAIIRRELPETEVLILTSFMEGDLVARAIRAGAISYVLKNARPDELRGAIKAAAAGQIHLSSRASAYLLDGLRLSEPSHTSLSGRETEVLHFLAQGQSNREIACSLHVDENTVKTHIRHILSKLGVQSRTQAVLVAMRLGLVAHS
jgi:two-component system, NarL family, response regulator LiaR